MYFLEVSNLPCVVGVGSKEDTVGFENEETKGRILHSFQKAQKMGLAQGWLGPGNPQLGDFCFACNAAELMERFGRRPEDTIFFWEIPTPVYPAKNAT